MNNNIFSKYLNESKKCKYTDSDSDKDSGSYSSTSSLCNSMNSKSDDNSKYEITNLYIPKNDHKNCEKIMEYNDMGTKGVLTVTKIKANINNGILQMVSGNCVKLNHFLFGNLITLSINNSTKNNINVRSSNNKYELKAGYYAVLNKNKYDMWDLCSLYKIRRKKEKKEKLQYYDINEKGSECFTSGYENSAKHNSPKMNINDRIKEYINAQMNECESVYENDLVSASAYENDKASSNCYTK